MSKLLLFLTAFFLSNVNFSQNCNNWLYTSSNTSYVSVGDIDVSGNQLTIEASFNRTFALNSGLYPGHLVSKHTDFTNSNYSLFPNGCAINTSNGYYSTFENCSFSLNKTYHVAMVYDGATLKFYRNGYLLSSTSCSGNLLTNNLNTTIGQVSDPSVNINQFLGYINEVRIWNVARSQSELQQFLSNSLPNPTTQSGLLGYYTFDNLNNKQGNTAFNATLNGSTSINATNTNCTFIADSCELVLGPSGLTCNNWLRTSSFPSTINVGDIDVAGSTITVETNFNILGPTPNTSWGHLISKHTSDVNMNYALSPNGVEIQTTTGYHFILQPCTFSLNKTYHVALVYDGSELKFYRNGFLLGSKAVSGTLFQNNLSTIIANVSGSGAANEQVNGLINEVRIWNVARTQTQLQTYMNTSLPNPTTQTGLLAYYTFNNLVNKQGNAAFNGTINGSASINQTNPICTFITDSCELMTIPNNIEIFKGQLVNKKVHLLWKMDELTDTKNFEVQESTNGRDFTTVDVVGLQSAFNLNWFKYNESTDLLIKKFYRLKINDKSGGYFISKVLVFENKGGANRSNISFYPNPVNNNLKVVFSSLKKAKGKIILYSLENGKEVFSKQINTNEGINFLELNVETYPKGIYTLAIYNNWELIEKGTFVKN